MRPLLASFRLYLYLAALMPLPAHADCAAPRLFVTWGTSGDFTLVEPKPVSLPPGVEAKRIAGIAIDGDNNSSYAWNWHGTVSAGSTIDLDAYRQPYAYALPANKETGKPYGPGDIVGIGIDDDINHTYVWFRNGYVSSGSTDNIGKFRQPYRYELPKSPRTGRTYSPSDIVGMAIDGSNNYSFAWYEDGYVSAGTTEQLWKYRQPYQYRLPEGVKPSQVVDFGIDPYVPTQSTGGTAKRVYLWYWDCR
jgi:hypothetical protein